MRSNSQIRTYWTSVIYVYEKKMKLQCILSDNQDEPPYNVAIRLILNAYT